MLMLGTVFAYFLMASPALFAKDEPELFKVEGNVTALPSSGFAGLWTIAGRRVNVTASTKVEQEAGPLMLGACAEAEGNLDTAGTLQAVKLESTISTECNTPGGGTGGTSGTGGVSPGAEDIKIVAAVVQLPAGGLVGNWRVGSRIVVVTQATVIEQLVGPVRVDSCVEVEGFPQADGSLIAKKVEVRSSTGGCLAAGPGDDSPGDDSPGGGNGGASGSNAGEFKHIGVLQQLPASGFTGAWVVGGRTIGVSSQTRINQEDGMVRIGACLEAEGTLLSDGALSASEVSVELPSKCGFVQVPGGAAMLSEFYGVVQSMPAGGREGLWQVGGRMVSATSATKFEADEGPIQAGVCVEVTGTAGTNGSIAAVKIDSEPARDCSAGGVQQGQGFFEINGLIEQLPPNGLLGNWTVAGRTVRVFPNTAIDSEHGQPVPGACVEVKGNAGSNGFFDATSIEIRSVAAVCLSRHGVVSAASFSDTALSPGKIISLFGVGLGPETPVTPDSGALLRDGRFPKSLGGVRVFFDDTPAPLVFTSRGQVNAVVPYNVRGKAEVEVQVEHQGIFSPVVKIPVAAAAPGIFTQKQTGSGPGAILNFQSGSYVVNTAANPARRGEIVLLYITGEGELEAEMQDGEIVSPARLSRLKNEVRVFIGGKQARVEYAGSAPGLVAGVAQLNVVVPADAPTGSGVSVEVEVSGRRSRDDVTLAIRP
jgi:uncharacterized protein (TIGR03437 family)